MRVVAEAAGMSPDLKLKVVWERSKWLIYSMGVGPACTTGYAITRDGARKLLYNIGYLGPTDPVDLQILQLCARKSCHNSPQE